MSDDTLHLLFGGKTVDVAEVFSRDAVERTAEEIAKTDRKAVSAYLESLVQPAIDSILDISIGEVLFGGWQRLRDLQAFAEGDKLTSDGLHKFELGKHSIKSEHAPVVGLVACEKLLCELNFKITVGFLLARVQLSIRAGRLMRADLFGCSAHGEVSCEGQRLLKRESKELHLPGGLDFGAGLRIPPPLWKSA